MLQLILIVSLASIINCANIGPIWYPASQVQTATVVYITTPTIMDPPIYPIITYTFDNPYSVVPKLASSLIRYQATGILQSGKHFNIYVDSKVTTTSFKAKYYMIESCNYITYRYMAINPSIPFQIDLIPNVGFVGNTTITSVATSILTTQSPSFTFNTPYTNYKFIFILTCFGYTGTIQSAGISYQPKVTVSAVPISSSKFKMTVLVGTSGIARAFHYTVLVYNNNQLTTSAKKYRIISQQIIHNTANRYQKQLPTGYDKYILMGAYAFSGTSTKQTYIYNLTIGILNNGSYGLTIYQSYRNTVNNISISYFYIQYARCPNSSYFLDLSITPILCIDCKLAILHSLQCTSYTLCNTCQLGYYKTSSTICTKIICADSNCILCSNTSLHSCIQCNQTNGYYLDNITNTCIICNSTNNYFINFTDNTCITCTLPYCLTCVSINQCSVCDDQSDYYLNTTSKLCQLCSDLISNCWSCNLLNVCVQCNYEDNYYLASPTQCSYCNNTLNYFINSSDSNYPCIKCTPLHCDVCSSISQCSDCTVGYLLNTTDNLCYLCSNYVPNCMVCFDTSSCQTCNYASNYYLETSNNTCVQCSGLNMFINTTDTTYPCVLCSIANCINCSSLTQCSVCDTANGYNLNPADKLCYNYTINPVCGDNIFDISIQQCNDGNINNNDGCSQFCKQQGNYQCQPNPNNTLSNSVCYYIGLFSLQLINIQKIQSKNQIQINFKVQPVLSHIWDNINFYSLISIVDENNNVINGIDSYEIIKKQNGEISLNINYNSDIHNNNITVIAYPNNSNILQLSKTQISKKSFLVVPSDNQAAYYYGQETYSIAKNVQRFALAIQYLSLIIFVLGIICGKIIGIQMMAVIQISFLSLMSLNSLNPCFAALANMWFVNGFNYYVLGGNNMRNALIPKQMVGVQLFSRYWKNYNLTLLFIFIPLLFGLIAYILSKTVFKKKNKISMQLRNVSVKSLCEYVFNGLMFSGYIVAVSLGIQMKYGVKEGFKSMEGALSIIEIILLTLYIVYFVLLIKFTHFFGEFNYYFKKDNNNANIIDKKMYNVMIVERFVIGLILIFTYSLKFALVIPMALFLILGVSVFVRKPYEQLRHNYRFIVNMLITIIVLAIYTFYKFQTVDFQNKQKIALYLPIIVCVLLLVCIIYSAAFLGYEIYLKCKQKSSQTIQKDQKYSFDEQKQHQQINKLIIQQISKQSYMNELNSPTSSLLKSQRLKYQSNQNKSLNSPRNGKEEINKNILSLNQIRKQLQRQFKNKNNVINLIKIQNLSTQKNLQSFNIDDYQGI